MNHNPSRVAHELREHLASDKRNLGFLMGAGTSMSIGLPGIDKLTELVEGSLPSEKENFKKYFGQIKLEISHETPNVELVLNRIRLIRELLNDDNKNLHNGITGQNIKDLDREVCIAIHKAVNKIKIEDSNPHELLSQWLYSSYARRSTPVELFTTNYDLLFERALEKASVPFFDGFIGSVNPFFSPESVDADSKKRNSEFHPPTAWTRLWKLHGSINWFLRPKTDGKNKKITRSFGENECSGQELMIFPSRDKYLESRKLPFIAFQDRFRKFLTTGEAVLFILGYSFSDEHINEIIFQALRSNSRLAVNALIYGELESGLLKLPNKISNYAKEFRNLSIYGPDKAVIGGIIGDWDKEVSGPNIDSYWKENLFTLVDFKSFCQYLEKYVGFGIKAFEPVVDEDSLKG